MGEEYYPDRKLVWQACLETPLSAGLRWATDEAYGPLLPKRDPSPPDQIGVRVLFGAADYDVVMCSGRADHEDVDAVRFEVFGVSTHEPGRRVLQQIAQHFGCCLIQQYWEWIITPTEISYPRDVDPAERDRIERGVGSYNTQWRRKGLSI